MTGFASVINSFTQMPAKKKECLDQGIAKLPLSKARSMH